MSELRLQWENTDPRDLREQMYIILKRCINERISYTVANIHYSVWDAGTHQRLVRMDEDWPPKKYIKVLMPTGSAALGSLDRTSNAISPPLQAPARLQDDWTHAGMVAQAEDAVEAGSSAILELYRRSGLTWQHLASMFGVDRRAVHLWASGRNMSAPNAQRLGRLLALVRNSNATPAETRAWFLGLTPGSVPVVDLVSRNQLEEIPSPPRTGEPIIERRRPPSTMRSPGGFSPAELLDAAQDPIAHERENVLAKIPLRVPKTK